MTRPTVRRNRREGCRASGVRRAARRRRESGDGPAPSRRTAWPCGPGQDSGDEGEGPAGALSSRSRTISANVSIRSSDSSEVTPLMSNSFRYSPAFSRSRSNRKPTRSLARSLSFAIASTRRFRGRRSIKSAWRDHTPAPPRWTLHSVAAFSQPKPVGGGAHPQSRIPPCAKRGEEHARPILPPCGGPLPDCRRQPRKCTTSSLSPSGSAKKTA